jgi:hypothetical protein
MGAENILTVTGVGSKTLPYTHILDLAEDGFIKPHVDSTRVLYINLFRDSVFILYNSVKF